MAEPHRLREPARHHPGRADWWESWKISRIAPRRRSSRATFTYFDLATVVQTLISSAQTGVMTLSAEEDVLARLYFQNGNIYRAHFGHRRGDEAVHHLFQTELDGGFLFESRGAEPVADGPDPGITVPGDGADDGFGQAPGRAEDAARRAPRASDGPREEPARS